MKIRYGLLLSVALVGLDTTPRSTADEPAANSAAVTTETVVMFDGSDLSQWKGREDLWSHEDGQIVGRTSDKDPIDANTFLIWKG